MLKFVTAKAGNLPPETRVITRADGKDMKDNFYLVINLAKPHGAEVYDVLKKHGYTLPEVESYLEDLNGDNR